MDAFSFYKILWVALIILDLILARKLFKMYQKDNDVQKLMFTIGLLMCMPVYALAILGINNFPLSINVFGWSPLPILLAFIFTMLYERFNLELKKIFKLYVFGVLLTFVLFFVPLQSMSLLILLSGGVIAIFLSILQCKRKFDIASVLLFLSIPSFAICFTGINYNMIELALFSGFAAKISLILAFEASKRQVGESSSILVLKKQLGVVEENFSKLFSMLPDPTVIVDGKGTFLAISSSVVKITGYKTEDLLGNNFVTTDLITSHSKVVLVKNLAKRMLGLHIEPYEIEIKLKNGKTLQFELNALKIEYKGRPADMVIFRDLTERNRLLEFSNLLFEFAPDPFYINDLRGNFIDGNKAAQNLLEYEKKELIGKNFLKLNLLQNRQIPKAAKLLALNRLGKRTGPDEFQLNRRNGGQVSVEISTYPLKTKDQTVVIGIARDITERCLLYTSPS